MRSIRVLGSGCEGGQVECRARRLARRWLLIIVLIGLVLASPGDTPVEGALPWLTLQAAELQTARFYTRAVDGYEQLADLLPADPQPLVCIGYIYLTQHRWPLAEDAFNRALARRANCIPAWAGLAEATWWQARPEQALIGWQTALTYAPTDGALRLRLARALLRLERLTEAERILLERLPAEVPGTPTDESLAAADIPNATPAVLESPTWGTEDGLPVLVPGLCRSRSPGYAMSQSEPCPHLSVPVQETDAVARLYLAALQAPYDPESARRALNALSDQAPPPALSARAYLLQALTPLQGEQLSADGAVRRFGLAMAQLGQWALARPALARVVALDARNAEALAFLGYAEAQLGHTGLDHLQAAIAMRPEWPLAHYLLARYHLNRSAYQPAREALETVLRLDPGNVVAWLEAARAYIGLGRYAEAETALRRAVALAPTQLTCHLALVDFYASQPHLAAGPGLAAARAAAELAPQDPSAREALGWMYLLAGDLEQAGLHLRSALQLDPERASLHYRLGVLYRAQGDPTTARIEFLRAIDLDTDQGYRERAWQALRELDTK